MLCKKVVNFFSLLSHTHESGAHKMSITQDLLSLVTGLAHYLKILIRIALTAALKLERDYASRSALSHFLSRLDRLCKDPEALKSPTNVNMLDESGPLPIAAEETNRRPYGYKSLTRLGGSVIGQTESITDLCEACQQTVEEDCIRLGTTFRWHLQCLCCAVCKRHASREKEPARAEDGTVRALYWENFTVKVAFDELQIQHRANARQPYSRPGTVFCCECPSGSMQETFRYVTRLEQYAFLLFVALNKLFRLLKQRGVVPSSPSENLFTLITEVKPCLKMHLLQHQRHCLHKLSSTMSALFMSNTGALAK